MAFINSAQKTIFGHLEQKFSLYLFTKNISVKRKFNFLQAILIK
jgi:hypothetical protein